MATRRIPTLLTTAVLLAVALPASIGAAAPVSAAGPTTSTTVGEPVVEPASFDDCPSGRICIYIATNGGGLPGATSVQRLWTGGNCTGSYREVFPGNDIGNLGATRWSVGGR